MDFHIFQETRQGARHTNQDRIGYLYTKEAILLIVCDGMGGHHRGELAAEFVVQYIAKAFRSVATPRLNDPAQFLFRSVHAAHEALLRYAAKENMKEVPRTTCVAAVIQDGRVTFSNVGDSRLYLIRDKSVFMRTLDHSHVQTLIDRGQITTEEAEVHPERNKIYNCIGQSVAPRVDVKSKITLIKDDVLLLATDGLWGPIPMPYVATMLQSGGASVGLKMLMDLSESVTGRECDNLSAVVIHWSGLTGEPTSGDEAVPENKQITDDELALTLTAVKAGIHGKSYLRN